MNIKGIISVSGQPGLYKIVTQTKFGLVVESLADGRRMPTYASQRISALEDISIYTSEEDMPLGDVFTRIKDKESGGPAPDSKADPEKLKEYFATVMPEYDRDRVYVSDIKKVIGWYNILQEKDLLNVPEEEAAPEETAEEKTSEEKEASSETAKKEPKKAAPKKASGDKPKKKAPKAGGGDKISASKASAPARAGTRKSTGTTRKTGGGG